MHLLLHLAVAQRRLAVPFLVARAAAAAALAVSRVLLIVSVGICRAHQTHTQVSESPRRSSPVRCARASRGGGVGDPARRQKSSVPSRRSFSRFGPPSRSAAAADPFTICFGDRPPSASAPGASSTLLSGPGEADEGSGRFCAGIPAARSVRRVALVPGDARAEAEEDAEGEVGWWVEGRKRASESREAESERKRKARQGNATRANARREGGRGRKRQHQRPCPCPARCVV